MPATSRQLFSFSGADGEKFVVMKCVQHGTHVVIGLGNEKHISCLHLSVREAIELADVLRAGPDWHSLQLVKPHPAHPKHNDDKQGSVTVDDGFYCITVSGDLYVVSIAPRNLPAVMAVLGPASRARVTAAISELVHGKAAAA